MLDMGEPVRIADLARRLISESGRRIELVFTGLRPGEKLHEVLFGPDEISQTSAHPMIAIGRRAADQHCAVGAHRFRRGRFARSIARPRC